MALTLQYGFSSASRLVHASDREHFPTPSATAGPSCARPHSRRRRSLDLFRLP